MAQGTTARLVQRGLRERRRSATKRAELAKQFSGPNVAEFIVKFLDQHPDVKAVFWRRGGRPRTARFLKQHSTKFYGNFIFDNRYELMNKASSFPGMYGSWPKSGCLSPWLGQIASKRSIRKGRRCIST